MGKTIRYVDYGYGPGNPEYDARFPNVKSKKHQTRDRAPKKKLGKCFYPGVKMSHYEMKRKQDEADKKDSLSL